MKTKQIITAPAALLIALISVAPCEGFDAEAIRAEARPAIRVEGDLVLTLIPFVSFDGLIVIEEVPVEPATFARSFIIDENTDPLEGEWDISGGKPEDPLGWY